MSQRISKRYYKTLWTSVINSQLSPLSAHTHTHTHTYTHTHTHTHTQAETFNAVFFTGILRDKTMDVKLLYIPPYDNKQNYQYLLLE